MQKIISILYCSTVLACSTATIAATNNEIVAGVNLGSATIRTFDSMPTNVTLFNQDNGSFSWGLFGGYNYALSTNLMLGGQFGYNDYGSNDYQLNTNKFKIESSALDLLAVATYVWQNNINVFAKAGGTYVTQHMNGTLNGTNVSDESSIVPEIGLGAGYIYRNINFNIEYRHIFGDGHTSFNDTFNNSLTPNGFNKVAAIDAVYLGISYKFSF